MFLLRSAFWLTLVLFLIPGEGAGDAKAGALEALLAARGAVVDLAGMCDRQPEVCANGGAALLALGARARDGAATLYQAFDGKLAGDDPMKAMGDAARGTLLPEDAAPAWQAPARNSGDA